MTKDKRTIKIKQLECSKCGYKWTPTQAFRKRCPNHACRSSLWWKTEDRKK